MMKPLGSLLHQSGRSQSSQVLRGAGAALVVQVAGLAVAYVFQALMARWLGVGPYGVVVYVIAWVTVLSIFAQLGLHVAVMRFLPEYLVHQRHDLIRGFLRFSPMVVWAAGSVIAACGGAAAMVIDPNWSSTYTTPLVIGLWLTPIYAATTLYSRVLRSLGRIVLAYAPMQVLRPALYIVPAYVASRYWPGRTAEGVVIGLLLASACVALFNAASIRVLVRRQHIKADQPAYDRRHWLKTAVPMLMTGTASIVISNTDVIMIGLYMTQVDVGVYFAATRVARLLTVALLAVNAVVAPMISGTYAAGDRAGLERLVRQSAHLVFWPTLVVAAALFIGAPWVLAIFGAKFVVGATVTRILCVGQLCNAATGCVQHLLNMTGHQNSAARVYVVSAVLNFVLNAIMIPLFGAEGAAIATAFTMVLWNVWMLVIVSRQLNLRPSIVTAFLPRR